MRGRAGLDQSAVSPDKLCEGCGLNKDFVNFTVTYGKVRNYCNRCKNGKVKKRKQKESLTALESLREQLEQYWAAPITGDVKFQLKSAGNDRFVIIVTCPSLSVLPRTDGWKQAQKFLKENFRTKSIVVTYHLQERELARINHVPT